MERGVIDTQDHDSKFRALANLDLNVDLEATMESEDMQGNNEDSGVHMGETELANGIN